MPIVVYIIGYFVTLATLSAFWEKLGIKFDSRSDMVQSITMFSFLWPLVWFILLLRICVELVMKTTQLFIDTFNKKEKEETNERTNDTKF
jgi:hypothetical protein